MSKAMFDLDAYCARIAYDGPREPTLAAFRAIVLGHARAIPFENLDVLLDRGVRLDLPALADKLVARRRGGYCFEHNTLLLAALRRLGFDAEGLAARVVWNQPADFVGPRTHMLLRVALPEGPHIADVGFGGLTPTAPLALREGIVQQTPHESFRLQAAEGGFTLAARRGGQWQSLYRFTLDAQAPVDYEVANWFTATHPQSLFRNHLMAARATAEGHHTLFDDRFAIRRRDGTSERRRIRDAADLALVLAAHFGIALSAEELAPAAARVLGHDGPDPFEGGARR
jgi:N-hydroxyarylamine O-acetyltransferase